MTLIGFNTKGGDQSVTLIPSLPPLANWSFLKFYSIFESVIVNRLLYNKLITF
jgi:hypothetical protein